MQSKLKEFIDKTYHKRSDQTLSVAAIHRAFVETLTPDEARLCPKWHVRKMLDELGYLVALDASGTIAVAGLSTEPMPRYEKINGRLTFVRP
jgi:hypothetical protein